jgi:DNA-binding SARP family transcriptional activator
MSWFDLRLLGTFQLTREGEQAAEFRSEKERALLAYLAMEASRAHSRVAE